MLYRHPGTEQDPCKELLHLPEQMQFLYKLQLRDHDTFLGLAAGRLVLLCRQPLHAASTLPCFPGVLITSVSKYFANVK